MRNVAERSAPGKAEEHAFDVLARAVAPYVAALLLGRATAATLFSQRDGERPAGCGAAKYLRVHRLAREANDPGATRQGRARLLTPDAWDRWASAIPSRARRTPEPAPVSAVSIDDVVARKLGVRRSA